MLGRRFIMDASACWLAVLPAATGLFLGACASMKAPPPPDNQVRAAIVDYGIYTNLVIADRSGGGARDWWGVTAEEHGRTATQIPFEEGLSFGFRFRLEGNPDPDAIDFFVCLPPEEEGEVPQCMFFRHTAAETRANPFIGYRLETGEPMPCGTYSMFICHDGRLLCWKQFEVLPPGTDTAPEPTP